MTMQAAVLHMDNSKDTLTEKLYRMVELYESKFGVLPNCCHINPKTDKLVPDYTAINGFGENTLMLKIVRDDEIPLYGFWLGVDDQGIG